MGAMLLALENVDAFYGKAIALQGVSFQVSEGEIVSLLGRNGAGKTTTLRTCMGLLACASGRRVLAGQDVTRDSPHLLSRRGLAYVPEDRQVFPNLTVEENLALACVAHPPGHWTMKRVHELFPRLRERASSNAMSLSGGEQQMLSIARAVLTNPKVLMLDEPTEGLAPLVVRAVRDAIVSVNAAGMAVVLVEQKLSIPLEISHRLYVMDHGSVAWSGTPDEFRADRASIEKRMAV